MPNLRVIYDNAANSASLSASSTSGALVAANMLSDVKVMVHRSTGTTVVYTLTWSVAKLIGAVALPATNLTPSATVRVQLFSDAAGATQVADSGTKLACPANTLGIHSWGANLDANAFSFGGASKVAVWFSSQQSSVRRCVITLTDSSNPAGYIDCSRIIAGPYWESERNPSYGMSAGIQDLSKTARTDSGDCVVSRGAQFQTLSVSLADLSESGRAALAKIVRSCGAYQNLFYSVFPDSSLDASAEQDHMIYGKRANNPFTADYFNGHSTRLEIEGW